MSRPSSVSVARRPFACRQAEAQRSFPPQTRPHAEGRLVSVFGEKFVEEDYRQRAARHGEVARACYGELDARFRKLLEAFVAGIKQRMKERPDKAPAWAFEPEPWEPVALGRFIVWGWSVGQAFSDLGERYPAGGFGSNQWAISPKRSAEGCVITCIDPHVSWFDEFRWYEAHVHGGKFNCYGFAVLGTPERLLALSYAMLCPDGG